MFVFFHRDYDLLKLTWREVRPKTKLFALTKDVIHLFYRIFHKHYLRRIQIEKVCVLSIRVYTSEISISTI